MRTRPASNTTRVTLRVTLAVTAAALAAALTPAQASSSASSPVSPVVLPTVVAQRPVPWTPNVSAGTKVGATVCNQQWFGSGSLTCLSEVYGTAEVNGDVIVVGAFTRVCQPGPLTQGLCATGTQVTRNDIFAYQASTGKIDPHFAPKLDKGPVYTVIPGPKGSDTVYVGGAFHSVNGHTHKGLVQLYVHPKILTGTTADGAVVAGFRADVSNFVKALALSPDGKAVYVGGEFLSVNGKPRAGLARVSAATGTVDTKFYLLLSQPPTGLPVKVTAMDLNAAGTYLAVASDAMDISGKVRPRLAVVATGGTFGASARVTAFTAPILANPCFAQHDYVRGVSFAADGSFLVIADTGTKGATGTTGPNACDAVARLKVPGIALSTTSGPVNVSPSWIDYAGGDSFFAVAVAGRVVYTGGHNRWVNNFCGFNFVCAPNALLDNGLSALDVNTGLGLAWWHPETLRGAGTMYVNTFGPGTYDGATAGLVIGNDVDLDGGQFHGENAIFPAGPPTTAASFGPIPSGLFIEEGGTTASTGPAPPLCADDPGASITVGQSVDIQPCQYNAAENWTAPGPGGTGHITINGLCLDTNAGGTTNGTGVVLNTCSPTASTQNWSQGTGNTVLNQGASTAQGKPVCLDDPGSSLTAGTALDIADCVTGDLGQVWPLPAAPGPAPGTLPTGSIYPQEIQKDFQVPCMDDLGNATTAGSKVVLWQCQGNPEQQWALNTDGTIRRQSLFCLDSAGTTPGSLVVLNPCGTTPTTSQIWTPGPNHTLVQQASGLCLDDPAANTVNGTQLDLVTCPATGTAQDSWRLPAI